MKRKSLSERDVAGLDQTQEPGDKIGDFRNVGDENEYEYRCADVRPDLPNDCLHFYLSGAGCCEQANAEGRRDQTDVHRQDHQCAEMNRLVADQLHGRRQGGAEKHAGAFIIG